MYEYNLRPRKLAYYAKSSNQRDEEVMEALVTAGAMVAVADGSVTRIERDELVNFIVRQEFAASISPGRIAAVFDDRLRELDDRNSPNIIVEKFHPLAGLPLGPVAMRVAQHVAAADGKLHHRELQTMDLIRLILAEDSLSRRREECRLLRPITPATSMRQLQVASVGPATWRPELRNPRRSGPCISFFSRCYP